VSDVWQKLLEKIGENNSVGENGKKSKKVKREKIRHKMKPRFTVVDFTVTDGVVYQNRPYCERCGLGVMMADEGEFYVCGKCGLRKNKSLYQTYPRKMV
jgi:small subunit ribosomal protein S27Ae